VAAASARGLPAKQLKKLQTGVSNNAQRTILANWQEHPISHGTWAEFATPRMIAVIPCCGSGGRRYVFVNNLNERRFVV
jgi:hypothetical protein